MQAQGEKKRWHALGRQAAMRQARFRSSDESIVLVAASSSFSADVVVVGH